MPFRCRLGGDDARRESVSSSRPFGPGSVDLSDRKFIRDAIQIRDFSTGEYIVSRISGYHSFSYSLPVLDDHQKLSAIVFANFHLDEYAQFVVKAGVPAGYSVGVFDWQGVRLFRTPESAGMSSGMPGPASSPLFSSRLDHGFFEKESTDGRVRIYAFRQLRLNKNARPYMYISVGIPKTEILHQANEQMFVNLIILGIAALLALALAWIFGDYLLVKPINRLVAATRRFGDGEMTRLATGLAHGPDEWGAWRSPSTRWRHCWKTAPRKLKPSWRNERPTARGATRRPNRQLELGAGNGSRYLVGGTLSYRRA